MTDLEALIDSLPDPTKDRLPPRVQTTAKGRQAATRDRKFRASIMRPKQDTEEGAKRILEGPLFRGRFYKDGDWVTLAGGRQVWQKKVSDYTGSVPVGERPNALVHVEVKGISPGNSFSFLNLDKRNNPGKQSQQEKLTVVHAAGNLTWLFIGWWDIVLTEDGGAPKPIMMKQGGRTVTKWRKSDIEMTGMLIPWGRWLEFYGSHKFRSIRQKDRYLFSDCLIVKQGGRWTLASNHWWPGIRGW